MILSWYSIIVLAKLLYLYAGFVDLSSRISNGIRTMCHDHSTSILKLIQGETFK
jgi:hypothetical protein